MSSLRRVGIASAAMLTATFVFAWIRLRPDYSDGEQALSSVSSLRRGMNTGEVIQMLHPMRSRKASVISYTMTRPDSSGGGEIVHPLTTDRYLVMTFRGPSPGSRSHDPELTDWRLVEGSSPRDDVTIGRAFTPGPFKFYY